MLDEFPNREALQDPHAAPQSHSAHKEKPMSDPARIAVRLSLRVMNATPEGYSALFSRFIHVPEVPRVGDNVYLDERATRYREVTARDWGHDGTPIVLLDTVSTSKGAGVPDISVESLTKNGWERDLNQAKRS